MSNECIVSLTADPITVGHRDIIKRAAKLYSKVHILVTGKSSKPGSILDFNDKKDIIEHELKDDHVINYEIHKIDGALVDQAKKLGVEVIIRGLRNEQDLIYEMDMSSVNRFLNPDVETLYLPCKPELSFVSSSMIRELCRLNKYKEAMAYCSKYAILKIKNALSPNGIVLGVTGGIACGKSLFINTLKDKGWGIINLDDVYNNKVLHHDDYYFFVNNLIKTSNAGIVQSKDSFSIFDESDTDSMIKSILKYNPNIRHQAEQKAWKLIKQMLPDIIKDLRNRGHKNIAIECPLMFEPGTEIFNEFFDKTVCIHTNRESQIERMMVNRHKTFAESEHYLTMQMPVQEKIENCDYAICNNGTKEEFVKNIEDFLFSI